MLFSSHVHVKPFVLFNECTINAHFMQVVPNAQLSVSPDRGHVAAESGAELELALLAQQPGHVAATLKVEVRGSKPLKLPIRCALLIEMAIMGLASL